LSAVLEPSARYGLYIYLYIENIEYAARAQRTSIRVHIDYKVFKHIKYNFYSPHTVFRVRVVISMFPSCNLQDIML
jgi:hypothetical protein